jgi:hypothetical protein
VLSRLGSRKRTAATVFGGTVGWLNTDLSFLTATTGVIVCSTVSDSLKELDTVYRTTNVGRTWNALLLS